MLLVEGGGNQCIFRNRGKGDINVSEGGDRNQRTCMDINGEDGINVSEEGGGSTNLCKMIKSKLSMC